jgi:hypothetical protein
MATTGSRRDALKAGMMPARIPMMMQSEIARKRMPPEMKTGKLNTPVSMSVSKYTRIKPIKPPRIHMMADSKRNSDRILLFLAPMAFFKPMMGVLSFTVTNMILAIPNAPNTRLRTPIAHHPILMFANTELNR